MPRKTTLKSARARADSAMSLYIRTKYATDGFVKCITCDTLATIADMDCAHFISRGKAATRYVEENCHPACVRCNRFRVEHHMRHYTLFMIDTYGREKIEELEALSRTLSRRRIKDFLEIEAYYKQALAEMLDGQVLDSIGRATGGTAAVEWHPVNGWVYVSGTRQKA